LHEISTNKPNEEAIAGKTLGFFSLNETATYRAKLLRFSHELTSKITTYIFSFFFANEKGKETFKGFRHKHYCTQ